MVSTPLSHPPSEVVPPPPLSPSPSSSLSPSLPLPLPLLLLSTSFLEAQKNAEDDWKLITNKAKSLRNLKNFKNLENLKNFENLKSLKKFKDFTKFDDWENITLNINFQIPENFSKNFSFPKSFSDSSLTDMDCNEKKEKNTPINYKKMDNINPRNFFESTKNSFKSENSKFGNQNFENFGKDFVSGDDFFQQSKSQSQSQRNTTNFQNFNILTLESLEEFDIFKTLKQKSLENWKNNKNPIADLGDFRRSKSERDLSQRGERERERERGRERERWGGRKREQPWIFLGPEKFSGKGFLVRLDEWNAFQEGKKKNLWNLKVGGEEGDVEWREWEPLKKVKQSFKDFESKATTGELLQKVTQNLKLEPAGWQQSRKVDLEANSVPFLDISELLENFSRESEIFLDSLGVNKEVSSKFSNIIRKYNKKNTKNLKKNSPLGSANTTSTQVPSQNFTENNEKIENLETNEKFEDFDTRIAQVQESTGYRYRNFQSLSETSPNSTENRKRNIAIFTTASLPWMTGTAVNPLLRAAYLAYTGEQNVTLLVPWLSKTDQEKVYPNQIVFDSPAEQEEYVRNWLQSRVGFSADFKISFYPGKFSSEKRSILAMGDISGLISDREADIAVLEEPEHLSWYYHGRRWSAKFRAVVGIIHTNYIEYVRREKYGKIQAFLLEHLNNWMVRAYCHKVIRLSAATQELPRSVVCNVHGVGIKFLEIGSKFSEFQKLGKTPFSKGAYYLGKMVWSKGYRELIDLFSENKEILKGLKVDVYGTGEDSVAVQETAKHNGLRNMKFYKGRDHADTSIQQYKVFINPSMSDVVCTTTAEALAMGKIVVCAHHPSNDFFRQFPNCLIYSSKEEFVKKVQEAMAMDPVPLSEAHRHLLSWEAATDRFLDVAGLNLTHKTENLTQKSLLSTPNSSNSILELSNSTPESSNSTPESSNSTLDTPISALESLNSSPTSQNSTHFLPNSALEAENVETSLQLPSPISPKKYSPKKNWSQESKNLPLKTLSLSLSMADLEETLDRSMFYAHYIVSGNDIARKIVGAPPGTKHISEEMAKDLGLPPPYVERTVYGW